MEILNTIQGTPVTENNDLAIFLFFILFLAGLALILLAYLEDALVFALVGGVLIVISIIIGGSFGNAEKTGEVSPTRYEVKLNPNETIDALKYKLIEKRGEIYLIEEVKLTEVK